MTDRRDDGRDPAAGGAAQNNPAAIRASSHDGAPPADPADSADRTGRDAQVVGIDVRDDEAAMDGLRRVGAALSPDADPDDPAAEAASLAGRPRVAQPGQPDGYSGPE
jgi:hypothetical protein